MLNNNNNNNNNMANSISLLHFMVLFGILIATPTSCYEDLRSNDHVALFIFGDSLFDAGNNNYLENALGRANYWPFGETFFRYPTGRFCDGRIMPDYIAGYLKLPLIPPYLQPVNEQFEDGVNFASAGAGVLVETYPGRVIDLHTQYSYFKKVEKQLKQKFGDDKAETIISKALYLFCIGSNDYWAPFSSNFTIFQNYSKQEFVGMVIGNLTAVIKEIYNDGGRKFGFLGIGPLSDVPYTRAIVENGTGGSVEDLTFLVKQHNKELSKELKELHRELPGFIYSLFDFYSAESDRINNPSKYGFKESMEACCGTGPHRGTFLSCGGKEEYKLCDDPSEYLFFDAAHPTDKANSQFANLMWCGSHNISYPINLQTLVQS